MVVYKKAQYEYNILGASKTGWNFAGAKATVYERLDGNEWKNGAFSVRRGAIRAAMNVVLLVAVAVVLVFSVFLVRNKMLQNTQALGMALARSYAAEADCTLPLCSNSLCWRANTWMKPANRRKRRRAEGILS